MRPRQALGAELERLWAPWRGDFLIKAPKGRCFFCVARKSSRDRAHLVVERSKRAFVLLNRYPYNNGHLMVAPLRHVGTLEALNRLEWVELWKLANRFVAKLSKQLHAQGFNLGLNFGRVSGAGVPGHLHLHVVPRWNGDTNFMPILANTKVIPQSLDALYTLLRPDD